MFKTIKNVFFEIGCIILFLKELFFVLKKRSCSGKLILEQIWNVSTQSIIITVVAGFFVGAIMTVQFTLLVKEFNALGFLGGLSTSGTLREIGPLLIAFLLSGKVGAYTSAELGTMKVTEQIDAIRVLGANPLREIILPRFIAIVISSFFLLLIGLFTSIFGGLFLAITFTGINYEEYMRHVPTLVKFPSLLSGIFKSFVFAFLLASICTYKGYNTFGGSQGVGKSVISTAVYSMVAIVVADWLTSFLGDIFMNIYVESFTW